MHDDGVHAYGFKGQEGDDWKRESFEVTARLASTDK